MGITPMGRSRFLFAAMAMGASMGKAYNTDFRPGYEAVCRDNGKRLRAPKAPKKKRGK